MSARPWSIPASFVPGAVAALLVSDGISDIPRALPPVLAGLLVHLGANCINTVYDFRKGLDKAETADDRALVDRTIGQGALAAMAYGCFAAGAALVAQCVWASSLALLYPAALGFLLAFFYTADPLSLKYIGLGDLTIWACFGPILMLCTSGAVTGAPLTLAQVTTAGAVLLHGVGAAAKDTCAGPALYGGVPLLSELAARLVCVFQGAAGGSGAVLGPHGPVLAMALPLGLLTVNILHANNVRDMPLDRAAGAATPAQTLGVVGSKRLFSAYFASAYALAAFAGTLYLSGRYGVPVHTVLSALLTTPPAQWVTASVSVTVHTGAVACAGHVLRLVTTLILVTLPWCIALLRRMHRDELATLPQAVAQFQLLFGAALVSGLLPLLAMARLWLGVLFYLGGVNNLLMWHHTRLLVRQKVATATGLGDYLPQWVASPLALFASLTQMGASVVFILGIPGYTRPAAFVLLSFLLPVTTAVHDMWNTQHDGAAEYRDPGAGSVEAYTRSMGRPAERSSAAGAGVGVEEEGSALAGSSAGAESSATPSTVGRRGARRGSLAVAAAQPGTVTPRSASRGAARQRAVHAAVPPIAPTPPPSAYTGDVPTFLDPFSNEFVHFFKNGGMAGGLLLVLALGAESSAA